MCLAVPGKIVGIEGDVATVDYGSERRVARIVSGEYSIGDYVIVSAKVVSEKVDEEQVKGWMELLNAGENC